MKVIICGKGGSGKSTISALIAKALDTHGFNVLLIDADESNTGLHRLMGVSQPVILMDSLGGKKGFKQKLNRVSPFGSELFKQGMKIDDISEECISRSNGIRLLVIGKIHTSGEGCACPMGLLSKTVLSKLDIGDNEVVIIDTEAGIEHLGRGVDAGCDLIIGVVDPSFESFMLAKKMQEMAGKAEIEIVFVLNKVDDTVEAAMTKHFDPEKVITIIPNSNTIFMNSLEGKELKTDLPEINPICEQIEKFKKI